MSAAERFTCEHLGCDGTGVGRKGWCTCCDGDGFHPGPCPAVTPLAPSPLSVVRLLRLADEPAEPSSALGETFCEEPPAPPSLTLLVSDEPPVAVVADSAPGAVETAPEATPEASVPSPQVPESEPIPKTPAAYSTAAGADLPHDGPEGYCEEHDEHPSRCGCEQDLPDELLPDVDISSLPLYEGGEVAVVAPPSEPPPPEASAPEPLDTSALLVPDEVAPPEAEPEDALAEEMAEPATARVSFCPRCTEPAAPGGKHCLRCQRNALRSKSACEVRACTRPRQRRSSPLCISHARAYGSQPFTLHEWLASLPIQTAEPDREPAGDEETRPATQNEPEIIPSSDETQQATDPEACCEWPRCYADPRPGERFCGKHLDQHAYENSSEPGPPSPSPLPSSHCTDPEPAEDDAPQVLPSPALPPPEEPQEESDLDIFRAAQRSLEAALKRLRALQKSPTTRHRFRNVRGGLLVITRYLHDAKSGLGEAIKEMERSA